MSGYAGLLRRNRNYRWTWLGQGVSEIGDYFNHVAVFSLVMQTTGSGLVVSGVMLSRAIPAVLAAPVAGVTLDRFDRKRIMIAADLIRAVVAAGFIVTIYYPRSWLLYLLSALLMFVSPFFTSGRSAVLPAITSKEELHAANALTRITEWTALTLGTLAGGFSAARFGLHWAFLINAASFLVSAAAISRLRAPGGFQARVIERAPGEVVQPWREYREGLRYIGSVPLILGVALLHVGWAMGGGAAQILFALFGEQVFQRGPAGIGTIWGFAGIGLLAGGPLGYALGRRAGFRGYKRAIAAAYLTHGAAYIGFSLAPSYGAALLLIAFSRVGMAVGSVLNYTQLLRHTRDEFRGRVFSTVESLRWGTMMVSMAATGICSQYFSARAIGVAAGALGSLTGLLWALADWAGRLPEPPEEGR